MIREKRNLVTLPNGFELLFVRNQSAPVVALDLWVRVGSACESDAEAGMAHLVEHMLFKGTARRGPGDLAREVEDVGGEVNAYTSFDHTVYTLLVASRFRNLAVDLLADAVFHSTFEPDQLEMEKRVVLEEIRRSRDLPHHYLSQLLFTRAYAQHPYGRPVIGHRNTVAGFTRADCVAFVRRWYRPANMTLVVVGDADFGSLTAEVERAFTCRDRPRRPPRAKRPREPRRGTFDALFEARGVAETYFELAFPGPAARHHDVAALDLLMAVLGQGEASRLQHRVKLDSNLVHSVGAAAYAPRDPGLIYVGGSADPQQLEDAYGAICEEVFRLRHEPVGLRELERARENLEADFVYQRETVQGQAEKTGYFQVVLGDAAAEENYLEQLRRCDAAALRAVARKYLRSRQGLLCVLHPQDAPPPWDTAGAAQVAASAETALIRAPSRRRPRRGSVVRRDLPGGARLLLKVNPAIPVVAVRAALLGGTRREPAGLAGAFHVLASSLARGTRSRNVYDIAHQVDGLGGQLDGFSGRNSWGLKAEFLSRYLEDGLELFGDILCHPVFPEAEVRKVCDDSLAALKARSDNPGGLAFRLFEETLYGAHPYARDVLGSPESLAQMTPQLLLDLHRAALRPDSLSVAVAGDMDPDTVHELLARTLEHLAPAGELAPAPPAPLALAATRERRQPADIEQVHVVTGFLGARIGDEDRFPLRVANALLSGQGGRLFRALREERGLAYAVASTAVEGIEAGYVAGYAATSPEHADQARDGLLAEFRGLAQGAISADELVRAQRKLVGSFEIALQENTFQAAQMALDDVYGLGYRSFQAFAKSVFAVEIGDVVEAARRYLDPERHVAVLYGPLQR